MTRIKLEEAIAQTVRGKEVYMLAPIVKTTTIEELIHAAGFACLDDTTAKSGKSNARVDHGKIIACHIAGWPIAKIADEIGCSEQTVRNHITLEEQKKKTTG